MGYIEFNNNEQPISMYINGESYAFREVTRQELANLRLSKQPGAVYKTAGKLYYVDISSAGIFRPYNEFENLSSHMCGEHCARTCNGCPRTADLTVAYQKRIGKDNFVEATKLSWRIEKYSFVTQGIEFFNMAQSNDSFIVLRCSMYERKPPRKPTNKTRSQLLLGLANFIWPDFDGSYEELKLRLKKNLAKP